MTHIYMMATLAFNELKKGVKVPYRKSFTGKNGTLKKVHHRAEILIRLYLSQNPEAVVRRSSVEKVFLEISQYLPQNTCARVSFLIKLRLYQKSDSGAGVFL